LPQRHVGKDNVGRHGALVGQPLAQLARRPLEQHLVTGNLAGPMRLRLRATLTGLVSVTRRRSLSAAPPSG
jgi:hypothetical protein